MENANESPYAYFCVIAYAVGGLVFWEQQNNISISF